MYQPGEGSMHTAQCVYETALGQSYLSCRAMIDGVPNPRAEKLARKIPECTQEAGIYQTFEPAEIQLLHAPFGSLTQQDRVAMRWVVEGVAVMAWALGRAELPPFATKSEAAPVTFALGMFRPGAQEQFSEASLRDPGEIEMCALSYTALSRRLEQYQQKPEKLDFAARLKEPEGPRLLLDGVELQDGDLSIDGMPLDQIPQERFNEVCSIVRERLKALRWLLGHEKNYAAVATIH